MARRSSAHHFLVSAGRSPTKAPSSKAKPRTVRRSRRSRPRSGGSRGRPLLRTSLGKAHLRLIGIDDGAFTRRQKWAPLVAVAYSLPSTVEGVSVGWIRVDGSDVTRTAIAILRGSPALPGARAILVDGVAFAGFNLLDLRELSRRVHLPVVSVTRRAPEFAKIRAALAKYFPREFARRWRIARSVPLFEVATAGRPIFASAVGCRPSEAKELIRRCALRGFWPEPLRVAHAVGHAVGLAARPLATRNSRA